ncbi:MAG: hypothetical protein ACE5OS_13100 [Anaerolineae bacterium]
MTQEMCMADEVEVVVSGFFTTHHFLQTTTGVLGELVVPALSTSGIFRATDGRELRVERTSWWRGWYELREDGVVLGTARPQGFWRRTMNVGFRGAMYELVPAGFWSRGWHLVDEAGTALLEIQPRGILRRGAYLTIMGPVNADLLVFAYYLVNVRWQEQAAAASAAAGS